MQVRHFLNAWENTMKLNALAALAAATAMIGAVSTAPALALSPNEPGYYNDCAAAYVSDPALYERDCVNTEESLSDSPGTIDCNFGSILPFGTKFYVAGISDCNKRYL
jgi:hypothetical protein